MFASRLLGRAPLPRGTQVLRGGALSCIRPTVQPWKSLRQLTSQCTRPPPMAQRAPRPAMSGASLQPWRLVGGSARARMLCTPAQPAAAEGGTTMLKRALDWAGENRTVVGVLFGATLVMYGFYRGSVRLMKFFFNVSDKQIFEIGFLVGLITAVGIIGAGVATHRHLNLHIDDAYKAAIRHLRKHDKVDTALGGFWAPRGFKGYQVESWDEAVKGSERRVRSSYYEAPARRVQMVFQVKGAAKDGLVSFEAYKRSGEYHFDLLSVDIDDGEHLFLEGDDDHPLFPEMTGMLAKMKGGR